MPEPFPQRRGPTVVRVAPTRGQRFRTSLSHALPGLFLVFLGIDALSRGSHDALPFVEIAVGATVLLAIAVELRKPPHAEREAIGWVEVAAGAMLIVEGIHAHHPDDLFQPALFYFGSGVATLALGVASARLPRTPRLELDEDRFLIQVSRLRGRRMAWAEVASFETQPSVLLLTARSGRRHRIDLKNVANRAEILEAWTKEAAQRGLPRAEPPTGGSPAPGAGREPAPGAGGEEAHDPAGRIELQAEAVRDAPLDRDDPAGRDRSPDHGNRGASVAPVAPADSPDSLRPR